MEGRCWFLGHVRGFHAAVPPLLQVGLPHDIQTAVLQQSIQYGGAYNVNSSTESPDLSTFHTWWWGHLF